MFVNIHNVKSHYAIQQQVNKSTGVRTVFWKVYVVYWEALKGSQVFTMYIS